MIVRAKESMRKQSAYININKKYRLAKKFEKVGRKMKLRVAFN